MTIYIIGQKVIVHVFMHNIDLRGWNDTFQSVVTAKITKIYMHATANFLPGFDYVDDNRPSLSLPLVVLVDHDPAQV